MTVHKKICIYGFSILEVMIFASITAVILVAAVGYTVQLVVTMQKNIHSVIATHYVEEVKDWLDGEREDNWQIFQDQASNAGTVYCLNTELSLDTTFPLVAGACVSDGLTPSIYQRTLTLTKDTLDTETATSVASIIQVSWRDQGVDYVERLDSTYTVW